MKNYQIYQNVLSNQFLESAFEVLKNTEWYRQEIREQQWQGEYEGWRLREEERQRQQEEKREYETSKPLEIAELKEKIQRLQADTTYNSNKEDELKLLQIYLRVAERQDEEEEEEQEAMPQKPKQVKTDNAELMNNILTALILIFSKVIQFQKNSISALLSGNVTWQQDYKEFKIDIDKWAQEALEIVTTKKTTKKITITAARDIVSTKTTPTKTSKNVSPKAKARLKKALVDTVLLLAERPTCLLMMDTDIWQENKKTPIITKGDKEGLKWTSFFNVSALKLKQELEDSGVAFINPDNIFPLIERKKDKNGNLFRVRIPKPLSMPLFFFGGVQTLPNSLAYMNKLASKPRRLGLFDLWVNYKALLELARQESPTKQKKKQQKKKQDDTEIKQANPKLEYSLSWYCTIFRLPTLEQFKAHEKMLKGNNGYTKIWLKRVIIGPFKRLGLFNVMLKEDKIQISKIKSKFPQEDDDSHSV